MPGQNYYYMTALPHLGDLGTPPPISPRALTELLAGSGGALEAVEAMLLSDDLTQRQARLAGEPVELDPAVLSPEQAAGDAPLPDCLQPQSLVAARLAVSGDALWDAYFRLAAGVGEATGNALLLAWVGHEVALRNAAASRRAKTLGMNAEGYLVAEDLADTDVDLRAVMNDWAAAADPLAATKVLDAARWNWLVANDRWYTFVDEETAAYAGRLMLLTRWKRLTAPPPAEEPAAA
jgi:hypothetical protein